MDKLPHKYDYESPDGYHYLIECNCPVEDKDFSDLSRIYEGLANSSVLKDDTRLANRSVLIENDYGEVFRISKRGDVAFL